MISYPDEGTGTGLTLRATSKAWHHKTFKGLRMMAMNKVLKGCRMIEMTRSDQIVQLYAFTTASPTFIF
jgi:hypothetical protein